jgi:phosphoribosylanthranilate isomerase
MDLFETLSWLVAAGAARFVVTQVPRVGTLSGPDRAMLASVIATAERTPVVVSGGLSSVADLAELAGMADGPEGAIVGRALYDGGMDLSRAIAVAG